MKSAVVSLLVTLCLLPTAHAATPTLTWAGCGISKNAFMAEMAAAYKKGSSQISVGKNQEARAV